MKSLQGFKYMRPMITKLKSQSQFKTITNPISGKIITKCYSKKDCNNSLSKVLRNFDLPKKIL